MKQITITTDSAFKYLQVFNGILELTQKELIVLSEFVSVGDPKNLCTIETKKIVAENVGLEDFNTLNNYIKRLKDKGAIMLASNPNTNKDVYTLPPFLIPTNEMTIKIHHA
jgi:hypothetical protein